MPRMSARRGVREAERNERGHATVTGADEPSVRVKGEKSGAAACPLLGLEAPVKRDSDGFTDRFRDFVNGYGVKAMVADDLSARSLVVDRVWEWSIGFAWLIL